jgi:hypothetical protein
MEAKMEKMMRWSFFFGEGNLRVAEDRKGIKTMLGAFTPRCWTMTTSSGADDPRMMMKTTT